MVDEDQVRRNPERSKSPRFQTPSHKDLWWPLLVGIGSTVIGTTIIRSFEDFTDLLTSRTLEAGIAVFAYTFVVLVIMLMIQTNTGRNRNDALLARNLLMHEERMRKKYSLSMSWERMSRRAYNLANHIEPTSYDRLLAARDDMDRLHGHADEAGLWEAMQRGESFNAECWRCGEPRFRERG